jgi:hypothetical protein
MVLTGKSDSGNGWMSHELLTPISIRGFSIRAGRPTNIERLEVLFD